MASTSPSFPVPSLHHRQHHRHRHRHRHRHQDSSLPFLFHLLSTRHLRSHIIPPPSLRSRHHGLLRYRSRGGEVHDEDGGGFDLAVSLFNEGDYYRCHDVLEDIWNDADEPARTVVHGILQCAVGFHHLFNQNHRGAMMELGEGLCKLKKMRFEDGPFLRFEREISLALDFLYQTQKEVAACTNDLCLAMDGSERSYQLLGSFASGQKLYSVESDDDGVSHIIFSTGGHHKIDEAARVRLPVLDATQEHLKSCDYT